MADDKLTLDTPETAQKSWLLKLRGALSKTRHSLTKKIASIYGGDNIAGDIYAELEEALLTSDIGVAATNKLLTLIKQKANLAELKNIDYLKRLLRNSIYELLLPLEKQLSFSAQPLVIMVVGVNGAGKTTTIGKLARYLQNQGKSVLLAAGDTFRAAACEQLLTWGERNNVPVVAQKLHGDSASVCFDAIHSAIAKKIDVVIADTAGRLPTQLNLMQEITKVKRVMTKALPSAPHEILLVVDATMGQNALNQVAAFDDALGLTGLIVTKLDGTAKGGVVCGVASERKIAIPFLGIGEALDDLKPFMAQEYANDLIEIYGE